MKCPNCSNEVPETANVCGYCGERLKPSVSVVPPQPEAREVQQTSQRIPGWAWGLGGFVLIGGIVLVAGIVVMGSSGLFTPVSDNPSNQPVEPVAPIQVVITATQPRPPQPSPTPAPQWIEVFSEDFSNPSSWDSSEGYEYEVEDGRLILNTAFQEYIDAGKVSGDFRVSYDYQWVKFSQKPCGYGLGIQIYYDDTSPIVLDLLTLLEVTVVDASKAYDFSWYVENDGDLSYHEWQNQEGNANSVEPKGINHVQIERLGTNISLMVNSDEVAEIVSYPEDALFQSFYFAPGIIGQGEVIQDRSCSGIAVAIDNILIEEYRIP
jgi:hypothetical protein